MKRGSFVILLAVLATLALASAPAGGQEAKKAGDGQGARKSDASAASTGKEAKQDAQAKAAAKSDATRKSADSDESSGPTLSLTPIVRNHAQREREDVRRALVDP